MGFKRRQAISWPVSTTAITGLSLALGLGAVAEYSSIDGGGNNPLNPTAGQSGY